MLTILLFPLKYQCHINIPPKQIITQNADFKLQLRNLFFRQIALSSL